MKNSGFLHKFLNSRKYTLANHERDSTKNPFKLGKLPSNVESAVMHPDGNITYILKPYPVTNKWPNVHVDSTLFKDLSVADKMHAQSRAYLSAAIICCEAAGEAAGEWSQAAVCNYCLNLATELFLKACISKATRTPPMPTHAIPKLLARYEEVLSNKGFHFPTQWAISASDIEEFVGSKIFEDIDHTPDQLYRYGVGRDGASSAGIQMFSPGNFYDYAIYLGNVWSKAWDEVSKSG